MTILLTTHSLDEAEQLCDRVAIVHQGRVVALDRPAGLLAGLGLELVELHVDGDVSRVVASLRSEGIAGADNENNMGTER
jgi:ABC-type multidrug transport system ATPase subunit